jgi:hypothetical protein
MTGAGFQLSSSEIFRFPLFSTSHIAGHETLALAAISNAAQFEHRSI